MYEEDLAAGLYRLSRALLSFKNFKQRGEWVEMLFMARAAREGIRQKHRETSIKAMTEWRMAQEVGQFVPVLRRNPASPAGISREKHVFLL
jgi:hypothetical protein